jgi:hypothetical protein
VNIERQDVARLVDDVVGSFTRMPFVSVRIVCVYSSQDVYWLTDSIESEQRHQNIPPGLQVISIQGSDPEAKQAGMERAFLSIKQLPSAAWKPGATSILVVITDADGAFARQVAGLSMAKDFALFFGYRPDIAAQIRQRLR